MPSLSKQRRPLSEDEKRQLAALLVEAEARGIQLPSVQQQEIKLKWPIDKNGYFMKDGGKFYNPNETHLQFLKSNARFVAIISGRGGGKTTVGAQKALQKIKEGKNGTVISPNFQHFLTSTWPELREWIPWEMVVLPQRHRKNLDWEPQKPFTMVFDNGASMVCKGLMNPDSARGPNINWLWYDEAGRDETGLAWKIAIAGVRVGEDPQAWITTTPRGKEHWIYKFFVKQEIPEEVIQQFAETSNRPLIEWFHCSIEDNKENLDPGFYVSMLASYPASWLRSQELDGLFVDEGGVLGQAEWLTGNTVSAPPLDIKSKLRYWDLAASERDVARGAKRTDPDDTVGTLLSWDGTDDFYIEDQVGGQWSWEKIKDVIIQVAMMDGPAVPIYVEQEPGAGGKNQVAMVASFPELKGWIVRAHVPEGDKVIRANPWFAEASQGHVHMVSGKWNAKLVAQFSSFPLGIHDDFVDSVSGARQVIAPVKKWRRIDFLSL